MEFDIKHTNIGIYAPIIPKIYRNKALWIKPDRISFRFCNTFCLCLTPNEIVQKCDPIPSIHQN
jgi:hypothetical protein